MLNGLDLFSGIGGISLALRDWVRPIAYCEIEPYAQAVLISRMSEGRLPNAPICGDVRKLDGSPFKGLVDIIYGGFPCQDLSVAGAGKGLEGQRSGLFFEILRLAKEIRPQFLFLENVPGIRLRGLATVGHELADAGYDCRWITLSAAEVGAPHKRERWFLLGHAHGKNKGQIRKIQSRQDPHAIGAFATDSNGWRLKNSCPESEYRVTWEIHQKHRGQWESTPAIRRVDDGSENWVDRIKCLGNGVVPLQAETAFKILVGIK